MDKFLKWEDFLKDNENAEQIRDFLHQAKDEVLHKEENILEDFSNTVDINKVRSVLYQFLNIIVEKIKADGVVAYQIAEDKEKSNHLYFKTYYASAPEHLKSKLPALLNINVHFSEAGVISYAISEKKAIYVREVDPSLIVTEEGKEFYQHFPIKSHIVLPLFLERIPVGVIQFYSLGHSIDITDEELVLLDHNSSAIAIILKAILLYEQIHRNYLFLKKRNSVLKEELNLAKKIQKNLLPVASPRIEGASVEYWYKPMDMLGGDFFDFIIDREKRGFGVFISDVAGHGVPSALITTMIKSLLNSNRIYFNKPNSLLNKLNMSLFDNNVSHFFVTAFYIFIDLVSKQIFFASAGHNEMILYRRREEYFHLLKPRGKFLGVFPDIGCEEQVLEIQSGDRIVLYTDGVIDLINLKGEELGFEGFKNLLHLSKNLDILSTKNFLLENISSYDRHAAPLDDKCLIVIDIH